ncbi:SAM-dependent DNA methyltransferase [Nocardia abscessus]|uniref:HsdM family class I SAM-dependent methyltransferase n=1 Tax=Nocardia abscessus TaxID=120957 RepID=UPI001892FFE8|nr:class I SAM-dependent DNA methyltransferase [Nocardia abscessus]MBF6336832.1 SAM-dependent DNA methyltransferase [Nocardia abscessus]
MRTADLAKRVFKAAHILRGAMDATDYVRVMSVMLVLKWATDHPGRLAVPQEARWDELVAAATSSPRDALERAATALIFSNPDILDDSFLRVVRDKQLSDVEARQLISVFDEIPLGGGDRELDDAAGPLYEQVLAGFADADNRADIRTPRSVSQLMVRLADPQPGHTVYDPCVGTGGLLIEARNYVEEHTEKKSAPILFGQDVSLQACAIARLNLTLHGSDDASNILTGDTLVDPKHLNGAGDLKHFDRVLSNPPFSLKYQNEILNIPQQTPYGHSRSADLMFVQHVLASLAPEGVGVVAAPYGVLFRGGAEGRIRRRMIEDGRIAAVIRLGQNLFPRTSIPACLLVLCGKNAAHARERGVLFINAEHEVEVKRSKNHLAPRHVEKIATTYLKQAEISHFSRLVPPGEIAAKEYSLNVGDYFDPEPPTRKRPSVSALLAGGVPIAEVDSQRDRFAAFGIELNDVFVSGKPGYLNFPPRGYETTATAIPALSASSETAFTSAVEDWFQLFQKEQSVLTERPLVAGREYFAETFHRALNAWTILNNEQIAGLFVDWWTTNQEDISQLRRTIRGSDSSTAGVNALIFDRIGADLFARAKNLAANERNQLIDVYLAWGEQYKTSLEQLERRREQASSRLATQLCKLGYRWPLDGSGS